MKFTGIEWADSTWSPWRGCTKVSSGCAHCYAETLSKRNPAVFGEWGKGKPRVINKNWNEPVKWNRSGVCINCGFIQSRTGTKPHQTKGGTGVCGQPKDGGIVQTFRRPRVFPSLCDWLDEEVSAELRARFMQLTCDTQNLDWLLLTKRPENWWQQMYNALLHAEGITDPNLTESDPETTVGQMLNNWLAASHIGGDRPQNIWVGTSVEDQLNMDRRGHELLKIPAKVLFLSMEPLLGPVKNIFLYRDDGITGLVPAKSPIKWVIVGGESGHGARPCNVDWVRDIVRQCAAAGVPCFVKQLGANVVQSWDDPSINPSTFAVKLKHPKGGDPDEWPEDLRVRQIPEVWP